jgi:16S rRNA C967 or C1407 C5-methylase (RsmB/RsmF family)
MLRSHRDASASSSLPAQAAPFYWTDEVAAAFPPAFVRFLRANDIHPDNYDIKDVPRYVRVSTSCTLGQEEIERQLGAAIEPVGWIPGYFRVPSTVKIAGSEAYRTGKLYGIDVSSGAAVSALNARPGEDVLDLCCAPGAKLCAISESMETSGTLTGVDISEERLAACRTLCQKYGVHNARLLVHDGCTFDAPPPLRRERPLSAEAVPAVVTSATPLVGAVAAATDSAPAALAAPAAPPAAPATAAPATAAPATAAPATAAPAATTRAEPVKAERKRRRQERDGALFLGRDLAEGEVAGPLALVGGDEQSSTCRATHSTGRSPLYDKVLVDAECTHDGSIKHLAKFAQWGWDTFERRFLDPERLQALEALQLSLLQSGFRLLRPGGSLVYSTCSFAKAQNEDVVSKLLAEHPDTARLVPIDSLDGAPCHAGGLPHTLRFEPRTSQTSGLFIARIEKRSPVRAGSADRTVEH